MSGACLPGRFWLLQTAAAGADIKKLALHEPPFVVDVEGHKSPEHFASQVGRIGTKEELQDVIYVDYPSN